MVELSYLIQSGALLGKHKISLEECAIPQTSIKRGITTTLFFYMHWKYTFYILQRHLPINTFRIVRCGWFSRYIGKATTKNAWHKMCSNKIESRDEIVSQCDQLTVFHGFWATHALIFSFLLFRSARTRKCFRFLCLLACFLHWNQLDQTCSHAVNTILFGWLRSIKFFLLWIDSVYFDWDNFQRTHEWHDFFNPLPFDLFVSVILLPVQFVVATVLVNGISWNVQRCVNRAFSFLKMKWNPILTKD